MTARFGIETSILVRLVTGDPKEGFETCVRKLWALVEGDDAEVYVSNQVIGEAYVVLQHHYGVSKSEARAALVSGPEEWACSTAQRRRCVRRLGNRYRLWPARPMTTGAPI